MTIKHVDGDILKVNRGNIIQSVNCQGVMGAGLAKATVKLYPEVYKHYSEFCNKQDCALNLLGQVLLVDLNNNPDLRFWLIFGQLNFGTKTRQTDYCAIIQGLQNIYLELDSSDLENPFYIPYGIGCGLGGGDWKIVTKIIEISSLAEYYEVKICKKPTIQTSIPIKVRDGK